MMNKSVTVCDLPPLRSRNDDDIVPVLVVSLSGEPQLRG